MIIQVIISSIEASVDWVVVDSANISDSDTIISRNDGVSEIDKQNLIIAVSGEWIGELKRHWVIVRVENINTGDGNYILVKYDLCEIFTDLRKYI